MNARCFCMATFGGLMLLSACSPREKSHEEQEAKPLLAPPSKFKAVKEEAAPEEADALDSQLDLARLLVVDGHWDEALKEYDAILRKDPGNFLALSGRATALLASGRVKEAGVELERLEGVIRQDGREADPELRKALAGYAIAMRDFAKAERILEELVRDYPDDMFDRLRWAEVLSWRKQYDAALSQYEIILKARPDDDQVRRHYARVLSWAGRTDEAIQQYRLTLGDQP